MQQGEVQDILVQYSVRQSYATRRAAGYLGSAQCSAELNNKKSCRISWFSTLFGRAK
jgi:hypothetical protein